MAVDAAAFRQALGSFPTGVTVVTMLDQNGALQGLTASAFSAVSLDPPLVLVCVGYNSRSYHVLVAARRYAIHILREDQVGIARAFARPGMARGDVVPWSLNARGLPVLDDYLTLLECRLAEEHRGGDHAILVGEVESISAPDEDARPLLYYRGRLQEAGR